MTFVKGRSGNPKGSAGRPKSLSEALTTLGGRQAPGAPRGRTRFEQAALALWDDALAEGSGVSSARKRLLAAQEIANRTEGLPLSRAELKALVAEVTQQQQRPVIVPWTGWGDQEPRALSSPSPEDRRRWESAGRVEVRMGEETVRAGGELPPPSVVSTLQPTDHAAEHGPAPAQEPQEDPADPPGAAAVARQAESVAAFVRAMDRNGALWNGWRAAQGLPPEPPLWAPPPEDGRTVVVATEETVIYRGRRVVAAQVPDPPAARRGSYTLRGG